MKTNEKGSRDENAIRLLLDKATDVEEALKLLRQYDFHSSMGMMVHLDLADADIEASNEQGKVCPVFLRIFIKKSGKIVVRSMTFKGVCDKI